MTQRLLFLLLLFSFNLYSASNQIDKKSKTIQKNIHKFSTKTFSRTKTTMAYFSKKKVFFFPKSVWFKQSLKPKNLKIQQTSPNKVRLEQLTGSGAVTNWVFGGGLRVFALTSAAYKKKKPGSAPPTLSLDKDLKEKKPIKKEPKELSETNGNVNFGMGWSLLKEKAFSFDMNASLNFQFHIENQSLYSRFFQAGTEELGHFLFDGFSGGIICSF